MQLRPRSVRVIVASCLAMTLIVAALSHPARAAELADAAGSTKRPKICLVLSGGGARGAAHVGVIKVLEELHVPIDCIVGTSMGALVGGAYASGMSVSEMETLISTITTELLYKESPARQELSMRRKQDDYGLFFGPEIGVGKGRVTIAKGLVTGVQLETVLRQLAKAKGFYSFDDLPIPFRAVATDLVTGKAIVFSEGDLANVMRASMSVPGAVAPAEYSQMLLVDGMLTSNLPVETARAMGADIIIAVNVGTPLLKRDEIHGMLGVVGQMLGILTEQNVQTSLALLTSTDIVITPELGEFSTGDFDNLPKIVPLGEAAARSAAERLARLSVPAAEYAALGERRRMLAAPDLRPADEIRFEGLDSVNPIAVQAVMDTQAGKPLDQNAIDADMRRIYGMGYFEHVNYRFIEESGRRVMVVDAVEKSWGKDVVRFGLGLSSDFSGDAFYDLVGSYRKYWINSLGGEWRTDVQVGHTASLYTELYQPLEAEGYFFVAPHAKVERRSVYLYQGDQRIASYDVTSRLAGLDLGTQFARYGELRVGIVGGSLDTRLDTGPQELSPGEPHVNEAGYTARLVLDQLDSVQFARSGWRSSANIFNSSSQLGATNSYTKWDVDASAAFSFGEHTFNIGGKFGGKLGDDPLPRYDQFQWGGFLEQSGYRIGQLYGENIAYGRLMYYHRIMRGSLLNGAYGGFSLEAGRVGNPLVPGNPDGLLKSASIFIASDTPIGPAYLGYGHASDGNSTFYFYVGLPY